MIFCLFLVVRKYIQYFSFEMFICCTLHRRFPKFKWNRIEEIETTKRLLVQYGDFVIRVWWVVSIANFVKIISRFGGFNQWIPVDITWVLTLDLGAHFTICCSI
uniref:Uncharacterized protein n=1 Tax=Opuntia streptacantha TaxID=393608 RepID=A0A7C8YW95_OPUST